MSYLDGKVNDYFDKEFDFDKNGELDEMERYMQFDIINKLQHDTREDTWGNRYEKMLGPEMTMKTLLTLMIMMTTMAHLTVHLVFTQ